MDDSMEVRVITEDQRKKNNYTHSASFEIGQESRSNFKVVDYENAIITDRALYKNDNYFALIEPSVSRKE